MPRRSKMPQDDLAAVITPATANRSIAGNVSKRQGIPLDGSESKSAPPAGGMAETTLSHPKEGGASNAEAKDQVTPGGERLSLGRNPRTGKPNPRQAVSQESAIPQPERQVAPPFMARAGQREFMRGVDAHRICGFLCRRQYGKTTAAGILALKKMMRTP